MAAKTRSHSQRIIEYNNWNLSFESSVLPIRNERPSLFFEGTQGTLDLARDGYTFQPNKGPAVRVEASGPLEQVYAANFVDAIVNGTAVSAGLTSSLDACRPVQKPLLSYGRKQPITAAQLDA